MKLISSSSSEVVLEVTPAEAEVLSTDSGARSSMLAHICERFNLPDKFTNVRVAGERVTLTPTRVEVQP